MCVISQVFAKDKILNFSFFDILFSTPFYTNYSEFYELHEFLLEYNQSVMTLIHKSKSRIKKFV
jgi:hypothetical protein